MSDEHIKAINLARKAILEDLARRAKAGDRAVKPTSSADTHRWHHPQANYYSGAGQIPCPVCHTGVLSYSRAAYNGHVHARCSGDNCVFWME